MVLNIYSIRDGFPGMVLNIYSTRDGFPGMGLNICHQGVIFISILIYFYILLGVRRVNLINSYYPFGMTRTLLDP